MLMALTREISPAFEECQLTHLPRGPIDLDRARAQHAAYEWALVEAGCTVRRLDSGPDMPDAVFVEDIAVVLDEGAIITPAGRRVPADRDRAWWLTPSLRHGRPLQEIQAPGRSTAATCSWSAAECSSVCSARTNRAGIDQLAGILGAARLHRACGARARLPAPEVGGHGRRAGYGADQSEWVPAGPFAACR